MNNGYRPIVSQMKSFIQLITTEVEMENSDKMFHLDITLEAMI